MSTAQPNPHRSCAGHDGEMSCATLLAAINDDRLTNLDKCIVGHILNGYRTRAALAAKAKCAPTSIPRSLKRLEACGYVTWTRGGGRGKASEFTVIENCNRNPEATVLNRVPEVIEIPEATVSVQICNQEATENTEIRVAKASVSSVEARSVSKPGAGAGAKTSNNLDTYSRDNPETTEASLEMGGRAFALTPPEPKKSDKRGTRMTLAWRPAPETIAFAKRLGMVNGWGEATLEAFRDYWLGVAGAKGVKLDWEATFRNEVRKEIQAKRHKPDHGGNNASGRKPKPRAIPRLVYQG